MLLFDSFLDIFPSPAAAVSLQSPICDQENSVRHFQNREMALSTPLSRTVVTMPISISIESIQHLAGIADDLANGELFAVASTLKAPTTLNVESIVHRLMRFFLIVTGADVAFVRRLEGKSANVKLFLPVEEDSWRTGFNPVGTPPKEKHTGDGPCRLDAEGYPTTDGGNRTPNYNNYARERKKPDGSPFYTEREMQFLDWIQSEAWIVIRVNGIPKALICVCSGLVDYFSADKIDELRRYEAFVSAFYRLAELADERRSKVDLVAKISRVLPLLAKNPTLQGFQRAILTLLTCEHGGFCFDRAFLFWMESHRNRSRLV